MLDPNAILQNRYRIIRQLGRGGMGAVYEVFDQRLSRTVALKETLVETDELRRAFEREARLLANLNHPSLPRVIDHFSEDAGQYLVMDYIPGEDLKTLLEEQGHPFAVAEVIRWADELLDALEYLHTHEPPIIHRDIKPSNLKLTAKGKIILLDFGLAKGRAGEMSLVTLSQSILGYSPHFAPLEQIQGEKTSPRSDLYALAATLYNLLTNRLPSDALTRATALLNDETDPLQSPNKLNHQVPASVSAVLMQSLALKPSQRPANSDEMRTALLNGGQSEITSDIDTDADELTLVRSNIVTPLQQGQRSNLWPWIVGGFGLLLVIFVFLISTSSLRSPARSPSQDGATSTPSVSSTPMLSSSDKPGTGSEVTTASGLKYADIREGTGPTPEKGQTVTVHYVGTMETGKKVDSSYDRGQPADFRIGVGAVIKGFDEGLMSMKVGGKRKLIVPPSLGYGIPGRPPDIPSNATLIFEVELLNTSSSAELNLNEEIRKIDFKKVAKETATQRMHEYWPDEDFVKAKNIGSFTAKPSFGDLTGDGIDEVAVRVFYHLGGSGSFTGVFIYSLRDGSTEFIGQIKGGDRALGGIENVQIEGGQVIVKSAEADEDACMACYQYLDTKKYRYDGHGFVQVGKTMRTKYPGATYP